MGPMAGTLAAISMGAVYMGALTYIGNAPNLMVYAIATEQRRAHAELLRLHGLVGGGALPALPSADAVTGFPHPQVVLTYGTPMREFAAH